MFEFKTFDTPGNIEPEGPSIIDKIAKEIAKQRDTEIAKVFVLQIGEILKNNGIRLYISEHVLDQTEAKTDMGVEYRTNFGYKLDKCDCSEHDAKVKAEVIEEFRSYLKTIEPCEMPQKVWDMGVDNTCNRMLKEIENERIFTAY